MDITNKLINCKIGTIVKYVNQEIVKVNKTTFANENIIMTIEMLISDKRNISKITEPSSTITQNQKQVLTYKERCYLKRLIEPFYNKVENIEKLENNRIQINIKDNETFLLPTFENNKLFINLDYNIKYSKNELFI